VQRFVSCYAHLEVVTCARAMRSWDRAGQHAETCSPEAQQKGPVLCRRCCRGSWPRMQLPKPGLLSGLRPAGQQRRMLCQLTGKLLETWFCQSAWDLHILGLTKFCHCVVTVKVGVDVMLQGLRPMRC